MPGVFGADFQLLLKDAERGGPFLSRWPRSWLCRVSAECAFKQADDIGGKYTEKRRMGRRGDLQLSGYAAERKLEFLYRFFYRQFASGKRPAWKRMPPYEEQVKDKNRQAEPIMIVRPNDAAKTLSL
jgi:hypothetical protein